MHLGGTVEELMERMSSLEFTYWKESHKREPFGFEIENFRMGQVCAAVINSPRMGTKGFKPVTPSQFYPAGPKAKPQLTPRQQQQLEKKRGKRRDSHR